MWNWNLIFGILIISSPILFAMIAFPDSISFSWNEGRGGYLFAVVFLVAELIGLRIVISKKRLLAVIPMAFLTILYLISLEYGLRYTMRQRQKLPSQQSPTSMSMNRLIVHQIVLQIQ